MKLFVFVIFLLSLKCGVLHCYRIDNESYNEIENTIDLFKRLKSFGVNDDMNYGGDLLDVIMVWKEDDNKEEISEKVETRSKRHVEKPKNKKGQHEDHHEGYLFTHPELDIIGNNFERKGLFAN